MKRLTGKWRTADNATVVVLLVVLLGMKKIHGQDFGYDGSLGPEHWSEKYQSCKGKYQSPINIEENFAIKTSFAPLQFRGFDREPNLIRLTNNGHTVIITMDFDSLPGISGGPLNSTYLFTQFHFHWGDNDTIGSEDRINNHIYPIELHVVFFNEKYGDFFGGSEHPDGLTVLAYFFELSNESNPFYDNILSHLDEIVVPEMSTVLLETVKLEDLLDVDHSRYFTYRGSLTTPPCSESVIWIEFSNAIPISHDQITKFRHLHSLNGELLMHNFRPLQPLNGRRIYQNDPDLDDLQSNQFDDNSMDTSDYGKPRKREEHRIKNEAFHEKPLLVSRVFLLYVCCFIIEQIFY